MKPASIIGDVDLKQIKLGAGRIFKGTSDSVSFAGTSKFDSQAANASWEDLRSIMNDTTIGLSAEQYRFRNGVPSLLKKSFITGREGTLSGTFDEFSSRNLQIALGLANPINKLAATEFTVAASPAPTASVFTLDAVTGLAVGDELVVAATTLASNTSPNTGIISAINTLAITLREPLQSAPSSGWKAKERIATKLVFGGSDVPTFPLLYVIDFVGNKQFVAFFPKVSAQGTFNPNTGGGTEHAKIGITFDCYGVADPAADVDDLILASLFMFEDEVSPIA